jgi:hypothetical protein
MGEPDSSSEPEPCHVIDGDSTKNSSKNLTIYALIPETTAREILLSSTFSTYEELHVALDAHNTAYQSM